MFTTRPEILGTFGVAASTHWLASATAMAVLEEGGKRLRCGGCGRLCAAGGRAASERPRRRYCRRSSGARTKSGCGSSADRGRRPRPASIGAFRALGLDIVPGTGLLAACVPGAVDGWLSIARDYGTMSLGRLLRPAIEFAGGGYPLVGHAVATIASVEALFREEWPTSAAVYLPGGRLPEAGRLFRNPALRADLDAACRGSRRRRRVAGGPDRGRAAHLPAGFHCRSDCRFRGRQRGHGQLGPAPSWAALPATTWRTGGQATRSR